ncbi:MAG: hypothetical protein ACK4SY_06745 [Pyrobaculum sp.]
MLHKHIILYITIAAMCYISATMGGIAGYIAAAVLLYFIYREVERHIVVWPWERYTIAPILTSFVGIMLYISWAAVWYFMMPKTGLFYKEIVTVEGIFSSYTIPAPLQPIDTLLANTFILTAVILPPALILFVIKSIQLDKQLQPELELAAERQMETTAVRQLSPTPTTPPTAITQSPLPAIPLPSTKKKKTRKYCI